VIRFSTSLLRSRLALNAASPFLRAARSLSLPKPSSSSSSPSALSPSLPVSSSVASGSSPSASFLPFLPLAFALAGFFFAAALPVGDFAPGCCLRFLMMPCSRSSSSLLCRSSGFAVASSAPVPSFSTALGSNQMSMDRTTYSVSERTPLHDELRRLRGMMIIWINSYLG